MISFNPCACRDCLDAAISGDDEVPELCSDCEAAGCDVTTTSECQRQDAYGHNPAASKYLGGCKCGCQEDV